MNDSLDVSFGLMTTKSLKRGIVPWKKGSITMAVDVDILRKHDLSSANQKFKPVILFENAP